jgi:hypothetical protein
MERGHFLPAFDFLEYTVGILLAFSWSCKYWIQ